MPREVRACQSTSKLSWSAPDIEEQSREELTPIVEGSPGPLLWWNGIEVRIRPSWRIVAAFFLWDTKMELRLNARLQALRVVAFHICDAKQDSTMTLCERSP